jgi:hypothetical protein
VSEKSFPKPRGSGGYREPSTPSEPALRIAPAKRTVVTLADPPPDEDEEENPPPEKAKLSPDEVKALLAVNETTTSTRWGKASNRLAFAAFPALFVSIAADKLFGWWGIPITLACGVLWALLPMWKQDRQGW